MDTFLTVFVATTLGFLAANLLSTWIFAKLAQRRLMHLVTQQREAFQTAMQREQERLEAYMAMEA